MSMPTFANQVYGYYNLPGQSEGTVAAATSPTTAEGQPIPTPTGRTDQELRNAFLAEVVNSAAMPAVNTKNFRVQVNNGVLSLSGDVRNERAHEALISAAKRVAGENKVRDQLRVR
jgi:osmotically-inducible protein OsmY